MNDHIHLVTPDQSKTIGAEDLVTKTGGKAATLFALHNAGFNVPELLALRSTFFESWFKQISTIVPLESLMPVTTSHPESRLVLDQALLKLDFTDEQAATLDSAINLLGKHASNFAVRSSAPYEDTAAHSFAGIHDSFLNVSTQDIKGSLRNCFASAFSEPALAHQKQSSASKGSWQFAAILQKQIDCDVSGTGFSLHPILNDYDLSYFEANPGLGASVVEGKSDADRITINKNLNSIQSYTEGEKRMRVRSCEGSGTRVENVPANKERALSESQALELNQLVIAVEAYLSKPVEIEWGIKDNELFLLQARPITRWVPLPESMRTAPGERRILYMDRSLSDGMTLNRPSSTMGLDINKTIELKLYEKFLGKEVNPESPKTALLSHSGGRIYANLSISFLLANTSKIAKTIAPVNAQLGRIFSSIDTESYKAHPKPPYLRMWKLFILPKILFNLRHSIFKMRRWIKHPEQAREEYDRELRNYDKSIENLENSNLSFQELLNKSSELCGEMLATTFLPALLTVQAGANKPLEKLKRSLDSPQSELASKLGIGFPGNVVVQMNFALSNLRSDFENAGLSTIDSALDALKTGNLDDRLELAWSDFITKFGHRGPNEMDLAIARFRNDPHVLVTQVFKTRALSSPTSDQSNIPSEEARGRVCDELVTSLNKQRQKRTVKRACDIYKLLGDTRDIPKHYILLVLDVLRNRLLSEGNRLFQANKLDSPEDIFHLAVSDLADSSDNLKNKAQAHKQWYETLLTHVKNFPSVIDSRGYIPSADLPREEGSDVLQGTPISPGVVTGKVRLWNPEDPIEIKEEHILVAYVLDPGSTSQLISAKGVILEIGGVTQHGAVIAREFGIPAVSSIDNATNVLKEEQRVELDGRAGTIRLL